jgi:hypothetical protein
MLIASGACVAAAALPATATAAKWSGGTEQGRIVSVVTGADGRVKSVLIGWRAHCGRGRYTTRTGFQRPLDVNVRGRFEDGAPPGYRVKLGNGLRARIKPHVRGRLGGHGNWRGTFSVRVGIFRGTSQVDTCRLRGDSWSAAPAA